MTETSHHGALPIQRFSPLRTQLSPSRFAVVLRPPEAPETHERLGEAEAADFLEAAPSAANHFCFCSSDPSM